jgi:hypothetical protein
MTQHNLWENRDLLKYVLSILPAANALRLSSFKCRLTIRSSAPAVPVRIAYMHTARPVLSLARTLKRPFDAEQQNYAFSEASSAPLRKRFHEMIRVQYMPRGIA